MKFSPSEVLTRDIPKLKKFLRQYKKSQDKDVLTQFESLQKHSQERFKQRLENPFQFHYPDLPIAGKSKEIKELILNNQVVVIQGDTGSGKTTQIPKMCLELGMGHRGRIGCTQPRRIAALSISDRLKEETENPSLIGHKIRFSEQMEKETQVKIMTDGILLQEFKNDPMLYEYSVIIIDEAHERSLNIDILLGILKELTVKRHDLKIIITSATIDTDLFSQYFTKAPVLKVGGKVFPVTIEYRDPDELARRFELDNYSVLDAMVDAITDIQEQHPGNLLAFLATEQDIKEVQGALKDLENHFLILPLFGRLSPQEQKRIFLPSSKPKIILATNIAETSITIPEINYVVDSGLARTSRYSPQTRIQGLPIERISQASSNQRSGRAGRVQAGYCIRLYSEEDLQSRKEFTDPEILRSNLANVILQLASMRIDIENFPFITPPSKNNIRSAKKLLFELGAIEQELGEPVLTKTGHALSQIPVDVSIAKVLYLAQQFNIAGPLLAITSGITIVDPRIRPSDTQQRAKADGIHSQFLHKSSDFLAVLKLWNWLHENWGENGSLNKLRTLCKANYLHFLRIREWIDLYRQISSILNYKDKSRIFSLKDINEDNLHKSILGGFVYNVAHKNPEDFSSYKILQHNAAYIFPGSGIFKKKPQWMVCAEIRETSKVFLSRCAQVKPEWIYELFPHLCKFQYLNVVWNPKRGFVEATRKTTYHSFMIDAGQKVNYEAIAPDECSEIFWREGIVLTPNLTYNFIKKNKTVLQELKQLENQSRKVGLVPTEDELVHWYYSNFPQITSTATLNQYIKEKGEDALCFNKATWLQKNDYNNTYQETKTKLADHLPDDKLLAGKAVKVQFNYDHSSDLDGINLKVTPDQLAGVDLNVLARLAPSWFEWLIEFFLKNSGKRLAAFFEEHQSTFINATKTEYGNFESAILRIYKTFLELNDEKETAFQVSNKWEKYHDLHLRVKSNKLQIPVDVNPYDNSIHIFRKKREYFILRNYQEHKGNPFLQRAQQCYGSVPESLSCDQFHWYLTGIHQETPQENISVISQEADFYQRLNEAEWGLQYHKKFFKLKAKTGKIVEAVSTRVKKIFQTYNTSIEEQQLLQASQLYVYEKLLDVNIAKLDEKAWIREFETTFQIPKVIQKKNQKMTSLKDLANVSQSNTNLSSQNMAYLWLYSLNNKFDSKATYDLLLNSIRNPEKYSWTSWLAEQIDIKKDPFECYLSILYIYHHEYNNGGLQEELQDWNQPTETLASFVEGTRKLKANKALDFQKMVKNSRTEIISELKGLKFGDFTLEKSLREILIEMESGHRSLWQNFECWLEIQSLYRDFVQVMLEKPAKYAVKIGEENSEVNKSHLDELRKSFGKL